MILKAATFGAAPTTPRRAHDVLCGAMNFAGRAHPGDRLFLVETRDTDPVAGLRQAVRLREAVESGIIHSVRPVLEGGVMVAAADMAVGSGVGLTLVGTPLDTDPEALFCERPGRFLIAAAPPERNPDAVVAPGSTIEPVGVVGGSSLVCGKIVDIPLVRLRRKYSGIFQELSAFDPWKRDIRQGVTAN